MRATPRVSSNAFVKEADPTRNFAGPHTYVNVRGVDGSRQFTFLHVRNPLPTGANVTLQSATLWLRVRNPGTDWAAGTHTITARRVSESWGVSTLTYNRMPATSSATSSLDVTDGNVAGRDDHWVPLDVTALLAAPYYGFRLGSDADHVLTFWSAQCGDPDMRPYLEVLWTVKPQRPASFAPDGGRAVAEPATVIDYEFRSVDTDDAITAQQVQLYSDADLTTLYWDSDELSAVEPTLDLSTTSFPAMSDEQTLYGRARAKGQDGIWSNWSDPFTFAYIEQGIVAILSPADDGSGSATIDDLSPVVMYEFTPSAHGGGITERQLWLTDDDNAIVWDTGRHATTDETDSVTVSRGRIKGDGWHGTLHVRAWDAADRQWRPGDPTYTAAQIPITYSRAGGIDPVETLDAAADGPIVVLSFTRTNTPDRFGLRVAGVLIDDDLDPDDLVQTTPTLHYELRTWAGRPNRNVHYEVVAIVNGQESDGNADITYRLHLVEYWLVAADGTRVPFLVDEGTGAASIGETQETIATIGGRAPVVQSDQVRGYEGTLTGLLRSVNDLDSVKWRDNLLRIKGYRNTMPVTLLFHDHAFPVALGAIDGPSESSEPAIYQASVPFVQIGAFEFATRTYSGDPVVVEP